MAGGIFNPENGIFRYTEKMADFVILSVFWLVCSLPLFTFGPATAALYHTVVRCLRGNERNSWGVFFRTFRSNFRVGAPAGLIALGIGAVLVWIQGAIYQWVAPPVGTVLYAAYWVLLLLPVGAGCYLFPVLSRFTFELKGLFSNCARLAAAHLPSTVLLALILFFAVTLCAYVPLGLVVMPVVTAWLHSLLLERVFRPYLPQQTQEEDGQA